jgi:hypothetical protein
MMDKARNRATVCRETYDKHRGEKHGRAKLSEAQVREIRRLYASGEYTQCRLGIEFGVSNVAIRLILRRINWAHIK